MSFKKNILQKYLNGEDIMYIIGHDPLHYVKLMLRYLIYITIVFSIYVIINKFAQSVYIDYIFGIIGLGIYYMFVINFLDLYLDGILLTKRGLIIFQWDGLLKYNVETIEWTGLEAIQDEQNGVLDLALNTGDLKIKTRAGTIRFNNIINPGKQRKVITDTKEKILTAHKAPEPELDKFDVLVETLGEVILDYIKKN